MKLSLGSHLEGEPDCEPGETKMRRRCKCGVPITGYAVASETEPGKQGLRRLWHPKPCCQWFLDTFGELTELIELGDDGGTYG